MGLLGVAKQANLLVPAAAEVLEREEQGEGREGREERGELLKGKVIYFSGSGPISSAHLLIISLGFFSVRPSQLVSLIREHGGRVEPKLAKNCIFLKSFLSLSLLVVLMNSSPGELTRIWSMFSLRWSTIVKLSQKVG